MAKRVTEADTEIGRRIRARREGLGLSLQSVAGALGVTYQQVQKYERGTNRVAGGRLQQLATALNTTVSELIADNGAESGETLSGDARRLGYAFDQLPSEARRSILGLVEALATAQASSRKKRAS